MCYTSAQRATEAARSILYTRRNWAMMPLEQTERLREIERKYEEMFGGSPEIVVRAPGRVNLIGEHTDYNDGFVFPAAIDRDVRIAAPPRDDGQVRAFAVNFNQSSTFSLEQVEPASEGRERW